MIYLGKKKSNNTYIVAEIGINHEGSFNHCARMIEEISSTGADAVKLQSIDPERIIQIKPKVIRFLKMHY